MFGGGRLGDDENKTGTRFSLISDNTSPPGVWDPSCLSLMGDKRVLLLWQICRSFVQCAGQEEVLITLAGDLKLALDHTCATTRIRPGARVPQLGTSRFRPDERLVESSARTNERNIVSGWPGRVVMKRTKTSSCQVPLS